MGNPFEEESIKLYVLDTKDFVDTQAAENMARLPDTGKKQYSTFMNSLNNREKSGVYEPLKKKSAPSLVIKANRMQPLLIQSWIN
jgi:hypothetical protein